MTHEKASARWRPFPACAPVPLLACAATISGVAPARADLLGNIAGVAQQVQAHQAAGAAILMGVAIFAATTAIFYIRERNRWQGREQELSARLAAAQARADLADLLIGVEPKLVIAWAGRDGTPVVEGDRAGVTGRAANPLAFGNWLRAGDARELEACVELLKARGEAFRKQLATQDGRHIEADGRAVGASAVLILRDVTGALRTLADVRETLAQATQERDRLRALLANVPHPAWLRDQQGRLSWVNPAFAAAAEAADPADAVERGLELLDRNDRETFRAARESGTSHRARSAGVIAGQRRTLDVVETPSPDGATGFAVDVTEVEEVRRDLERQMAAHERTLDALTTAVAVFDGAQRLVFHNSAYRDLWSLDPGLLEGRPADGELLDILRSQRRLPEQADFRNWKAGLLATYHSLEPRQDWWHLPDGRMLRVIISPNPRGGVTYLFDDVSEEVHLKSRYNALMRVQGETLDSLAEGVAVFGMDGRLKLCNPAFSSLWRLDDVMVQADKTGERAHIDRVSAACMTLAPDDTFWDEARAMIVGSNDRRQPLARRIARRDGTVVEAALTPLPDGASLVTFADVTASVNVERALVERNDALEQAARLRDDFVHHVSYQLRSPLTTIIGFTQMLVDGTAGPLSEKQHEYAGHIGQSSEALLALINDILDLATIDTGTMELRREPLDIARTIAAATSGIADRLSEARLKLIVDIPDGIGTLSGDARRVRQILFNLLSNAVAFSLPDQEIVVSARRRPGEVVLSVKDTGRGIPPEVRERVFERFESHRLGSRHRGIGLGLAIVRSFVELHGGRVLLESEPGIGTTVSCIFPDEGLPRDGERLTVAAE